MFTPFLFETTYMRLNMMDEEEQAHPSNSFPTVLFSPTWRWSSTRVHPGSETKTMELHFFIVWVILHMDVTKNAVGWFPTA